MPRRKPYHPYRNIRLDRRPKRQQSFALNSIHLQQPKADNASSSRFAIAVILFAFAMIIGGLSYMLTKNTTDVELLKSFAR